MLGSMLRPLLLSLNKLGLCNNLLVQTFLGCSGVWSWIQLFGLFDRSRKNSWTERAFFHFFGRLKILHFTLLNLSLFLFYSTLFVEFFPSLTLGERAALSTLWTDLTFRVDVLHKCVGLSQLLLVLYYNIWECWRLGMVRHVILWMFLFHY